MTYLTRMYPGPVPAPAVPWTPLTNWRARLEWLEQLVQGIAQHPTAPPILWVETAALPGPALALARVKYTTRTSVDGKYLKITWFKAAAREPAPYKLRPRLGPRVTMDWTVDE